MEKQNDNLSEKAEQLLEDAKAMRRDNAAAKGEQESDPVNQEGGTGESETQDRARDNS